MRSIQPKATSSILVLIVTLLASGNAWACWDGTRARTEKVSMSIPETYDEETDSLEERFDAEELAATLVFLDNALPDGAKLDVSFGMVSLTCSYEQAAACDNWQDFEWDLASLSELRAEVGQRLGKTSETLPERVTTYTVQLAAGHDLDGFRKITDRFDQDQFCDWGDLVHGGFPACNISYDIVTMERDGERFYRLYFAEFFDREDAEAARDELEMLGLKGFVRPIEQRFAI